MKKWFIGFVVLVCSSTALAGGYQPRDQEGGIVSVYAPRAFKQYSSTKTAYTYSLSSVSRFRIKPTANATMYVNSATGTGLALTANTEYEFGAGRDVTAYVFTHASSATKTKYHVGEH